MGSLRQRARRWWRSAGAGVVLTCLLVSAAGLMCPCPAPSAPETHGCCPAPEAVIAANDCCARAAQADVPPPVPAAPSTPAPATVALALTACPAPEAVRDVAAALATAEPFFVASPPLILRV